MICIRTQLSPAWLCRYISYHIHTNTLSFPRGPRVVILYFIKKIHNERLIFFEAQYHTSCQDSYQTGDNVPVTRSHFHHVFGSRNQPVRGWGGLQ